MTTPAASSTTGENRKPNVIAWLGWARVLAASAYFVIRNVPRYFLFTPESYGKYFWPKISWLFPHVAAGLLALVVGPLQFWPRMRRDYLSFHRVAGRIYVVAVLIGTIAAFGLATTMTQNIPFAIGL